MDSRALRPSVPVAPSDPCAPSAPDVPAVPPEPAAPLHTYCALLISKVSSTPLPLASRPDCTLLPPLAQWLPAASACTFSRAFLPSSPDPPQAPSAREIALSAPSFLILYIEDDT